MRATRNATKGTPPSAKKPVKGTPVKGTPTVEKKEDNDKLDGLPGEIVVVSVEKTEEKFEVLETVQTVKGTESPAAKTSAASQGIVQVSPQDFVKESINVTEVSIVTMHVDTAEVHVGSAGTDDALDEEAEADDNEGEDEEEDDDGEQDDEDGDEGDVELGEPMPVTEKQNRRKLEVFVGGLNKEATEDDVKKVFESVGDVQEVRMTTNPNSGKNKGYAFVRFDTADQAARAATELDRTKILDKECAVVPSEENDNIFVGNVCKSWNLEQVAEKLKEYGVEGIDEIILVKDPENDGHNRGHVILEFVTHSDAINAFKRLSKSDAIFGCDRSARVEWAEGSSKPNEMLMAKVKSVFVSGLPKEWEKEKIEELFGKFGAIERVVLAKNIAKTKRSDYAFVNFATRDAAVASIEALKDIELADGDAKVMLKVELAKLQSQKKRRRGHVGSYPVSGGPSKVKKKATRVGNKMDKGNLASQRKSKVMKRKVQEDKSFSEERPRANQKRGSRFPGGGAAAFRSNTGGRAGASSRRSRITSHDHEDYMPLGARISHGYNPARVAANPPSRGVVYPQRVERGVPYSGQGTKRSYAAVDAEAAYYGAGTRGYPRARVEYDDSVIYSDPLWVPSSAYGSLGYSLPRDHGYSTFTGAGAYGGHADPRGAAYPPAYFGSRRGSGAFY